MRPLYATQTYANAFGLGSINVDEWQTHVLVRLIPGSDWFDALGCYPLAAINQGADLKAGLERLRAAGLVSVALVPDPLTSPPQDRLLDAFDVCRPFKTHYLIDRSAGPVAFARTHRRMIRKAAKDCTFGPVDLCNNLADWQELYGHTVARHRVTGIQNFALSYFEELAKMPHVTALAAKRHGRIIAMILWVRSGDIAYAHLEGSSEEGYKTQAIYGIFATANEYFADCRILHFGGTAGLDAGGRDGLAYFKRGFANRLVPAYFCGSCLDADRYAALTKDLPLTFFFPAYRQP
jgi:Acetyltransferase (GNAT) domain